MAFGHRLSFPIRRTRSERIRANWWNLLSSDKIIPWSPGRLVIKVHIRSVILELNRTRNTTIILTTNGLGDVEALCRRLIKFDKGKSLYDGDIKKVNAFFGAYQTLKLEFQGQSRPEGLQTQRTQPLQKNAAGLTPAEERCGAYPCRRTLRGLGTQWQRKRKRDIHHNGH